jgi:hypothetical protein
MGVADSRCCVIKLSLTTVFTYSRLNISSVCLYRVPSPVSACWGPVPSWEPMMGSTGQMISCRNLAFGQVPARVFFQKNNHVRRRGGKERHGLPVHGGASASTAQREHTEPADEGLDAISTAGTVPDTPSPKKSRRQRWSPCDSCIRCAEGAGECARFGG